MNIELDNIEWYKNHNENLKPYISIFLKKNTFYLRNRLQIEIEKKINKKFNFVKMGLDKNLEKLILKPIFNKNKKSKSYINKIKQNSSIISKEIAEKLKTKYSNFNEIENKSIFRVEAKIMKDNNGDHIIVAFLDNFVNDNRDRV